MITSYMCFFTLKKNPSPRDDCPSPLFFKKYISSCSTLHASIAYSRIVAKFSYPLPPKHFPLGDKQRRTGMAAYLMLSRDPPLERRYSIYTKYVAAILLLGLGRKSVEAN